jgi:hypothetical protein
VLGRELVGERARLLEVTADDGGTVALERTPGGVAALQAAYDMLGRWLGQSS